MEFSVTMCMPVIQTAQQSVHSLDSLQYAWNVPNTTNELDFKSYLILI